MQIKLGLKQKHKLKLDFFFGDRRPQRNAAVRKLCSIVSFQEVAMLGRYFFGACAVLVAALVNVSIANAQSRPQDYHRALSAACAKEISVQCKGVADVRGQLLACLYEHQASLSLRCEGAVRGTMLRLGKMLANVESVR